MIDWDKKKGRRSRGSKMFNGIIAVSGACGIVIGYDKTFQKYNSLSYNLSYMMVIVTLINVDIIKTV